MTFSPHCVPCPGEDSAGIASGAGGVRRWRGERRETLFNPVRAQRLRLRLFQPLCAGTAQHCHRAPFLSILPSPPSSWLPFPLTLQKALRVQRSDFLCWNARLAGNHPISLQCNTEQGTLADSSTFQFFSFLITILVWMSWSQVCLCICIVQSPLYNDTVTTWGRNLYSLSITVLFALPFLSHAWSQLNIHYWKSECSPSLASSWQYLLQVASMHLSYKISY